MFVGIDIVQINRIRHLVVAHETSMHRLFTSGEIEYCKKRGRSQYISFAGIFSAKEAFFKALGTGFRGGKWVDVEVGHNELDAPYFILHGYYAEAAKNHSTKTPAVSISHDGDYAIAQVVWEE
ncbi:MAG: holo-ACP synthase [Megasphaera sp.]|jgi:holo-[acyl-carrier protein] synthase|nr:holo-ACP synthase [Megasphaera sp.]